MQTIAIIDYGMGNLRSVAKAVEFVAQQAIQVHVTADPDVIHKADRVIFPGQGAARACMQALTECNLNQTILEVSRRKPFLGICMGLQVLMDRSEENDGIDCLGLFSGKVSPFKIMDDVGKGGKHEKLKVPHMGWNQVKQVYAHPLWKGIDDQARFYFVHSYYVVPAENQQVAALSDYGVEFVSVLAKANIFAVQFHPEKSGEVGLRLLHNFICWNGEAE